MTYPPGFGRFIAGELSTHEQVLNLFSNFTWTRDDLTVEQIAVLSYWKTPYTDVFGNLALFLAYTVNIFN